MDKRILPHVKREYEKFVNMWKVISKIPDYELELFTNNWIERVIYINVHLHKEGLHEMQLHNPYYFTYCTFIECNFCPITYSKCNVEYFFRKWDNHPTQKNAKIIYKFLKKHEPK